MTQRDVSQSILERRVGAGESGHRLDRFLAQQPEVATRTAAKRLIQEEHVSIDDVLSTKPSTVIGEGQSVKFPREALPPREPRSEKGSPAFDLRVLFEDAYMLVIDKQPGLVAHRPERARGRQPNVADLAVEYCGHDLPRLAGEDRPGIVHRLDKDTSGVMLVAKNDEAFHFLRSQFKARRTEKEYRAIAYGEARFDSDYVERRIGVSPRHGDRMAAVEDGGRDAETYYEVVERFRGFTDFRCKPRTGRTHQIRVHMMSVGHSLVADRIYRSRNLQHAKLPEGAPDPGRHCLHAERLGIQHPRTREAMRFEAAIPDDMSDLLRWLRSERSV